MVWDGAASGKLFFCNPATWQRNFKQTTRDVALRFFQDHVRQIRDGCRERSMFSGTCLLHQLLWTISIKLSQPVQ